MLWKTPDFQEINLSGEVTAYVNNDDEPRPSESHPARAEAPRGEERREVSA